MCKGVVKDNQGETVIGASVVVKGSTNGTITGLDGDFTLDNVKRGDVIQISYIGYVSQEVVWQGTPLNITLKEDSQTLEEVVVVGFGSQKKANLTGSVSQVKMDDVLGERPVTNVKNALQGSMPGLMVSGGASPGEAKSFNIRGTVSINGMNPLVLIDNVEGDIDLLNPEDIESVTVLKDAASSAIYGARAATGVILITTKKAKKGEKIQLELQRQFWLPDFYQQSQTSFP
ncbi:TonB-dependent receptor plug domain-containing protein [Phocaeicola vulgatus]|nr:TonB-dependent receptor plug domain-containing protein [Phocaeicola vulgatus]